MGSEISKKDITRLDAGGRFYLGDVADPEKDL